MSKPRKRNINAGITLGISPNALNYSLMTTEAMARENRGGLSRKEYSAQQLERLKKGVLRRPIH